MGKFQSAKLREIAVFEMGQSPNGASVVQEEHGLPFLQGCGDFGSVNPRPTVYCTRPRKRCLPNDALISVRAPVGALNKADQAYCIGRGLAAVRFVGVLPNYGWHLLNHFAPRLRRVAQGSTFEAIGRTELEGLDVLYPAATEEQARIAKVLDDIDAAIYDSEIAIGKLRLMKAGLMHDLLTRGLAECTRASRDVQQAGHYGEKDGLSGGEISADVCIPPLRDPVAHPEQFRETTLGRTPKSWAVNPLSSLCDLLNGLAFKPEDWADTGLPIIRIQNLNGGTDFNVFDRPVSQEYVISAGTLLFSWSGNRGTSFGPFLWAGPTGVLNQHIFKVTPKPNIRTQWLFYALDTVRQKAERDAHGGSGLVHVRRGDLLAYEVATPSEHEQKQIEDIVAVHDTRLRSEEAYRDKLVLQKQGLMADLLTGRVRAVSV